MLGIYSDSLLSSLLGDKSPMTWEISTLDLTGKMLRRDYWYVKTAKY
jgi:hypothetical protein